MNQLEQERERGDRIAPVDQQFYYKSDNNATNNIKNQPKKHKSIKFNPKKNHHTIEEALKFNPKNENK